MAKVFAFALQKGGVGKTTTTLNLGIYLAKLGSKVLLVDTDPQANLTRGLGVEITREKLPYSIHEAYLNPEQGVEYIVVTTDFGVDLVPSRLSLAGAELEISGKMGRESILKEALSPTLANYDFILVDSPPNLGLFTANALTVAEEVIVPVQLHAYAYEALPELANTVSLIKKINPSLFIGGIICTMYDGRTKLSQIIENNLREDYGSKVFRTVIPHNIKLAEAPASGSPIEVYDPKTTGAQAYKALAEEFLSYYGKEKQLRRTV